MALQSDLEVFLMSNFKRGYDVTTTDILVCIPEDIIKFLIDRDTKGRTQSHVRGCLYLGQKGVRPCECLITLSSGTVDSYIGKLQACFRVLGKTDPWRPGNKWGNPCISPEVREYLKAMKLEQREAHVLPTQAPPLFSDKLRVLVTEIRRQIIALGDDAPFQKIYILMRDLAFYLISWWASDRAGDLGK